MVKHVRGDGQQVSTENETLKRSQGAEGRIQEVCGGGIITIKINTDRQR